MIPKPNYTNHRIILLLALLLVATTISSSSAASTIYVNNATGNNSWDGTNSTYQGGNVGPKATIQNGIDNVDIGGIVHVADGVYQEHVVINKNVDLIGQSQTSTIIDGANNGTPLNVYSTTITVILINFTIKNGNSSGGIVDNAAGGVYNVGTLTMTNCTVTENTVTGETSNYGGGVFNGGYGTLTMTNCIVSKNAATGGNNYGGGVFNGGYGTLTMTNCIVSKNAATGGTWNCGGGIYNRDNLIMTGCTVIENTCNGGSWNFGGGIYNDDGSLSMTGCTVIENAATGGIIANSGGGVYNRGSMTIGNSTFTRNTAAFYGGGILVTSFSTLTVNNTSFTNNSATYGGAIYSNYATSNINQCNFLNNSASDGGAMVNYQGTINANFCRIYGNTATGVGNAFQADGGTSNLENNWWGLNQPVFSNLLSGVSDPVQWLYMTITTTPNPLNTGATSLVTVSFNNYFNGTTVTLFIPDNHIPDGTPVLFQTDKGSLGSEINAITTLLGSATVTLTADEKGGVAMVSGTTDGETVTLNLKINTQHPATYNPALNPETRLLTINAHVIHLENQASSAVNAKNIGMQATGVPLARIVLAILMVLSGFIHYQKKQ